MSEGEVIALRNDIRNLSDRFDDRLEEMVKRRDQQHADNKREHDRDRVVFSEAMALQRDQFQEALNKQFLEHVALDKKVDRSYTLLEMAIGDGSPGKGRVGALEVCVETLKQFRWQALAIIACILLAADRIAPFFHK
jgi:hypothetical protein